MDPKVAVSNIRTAEDILETSVGPVDVDSQRIRALAFNSSLLVRSDRLSDARLVTLRNGSWLTFDDLSVDDAGNTSGEGPFGEILDLDVAEIQSIAFFGPRVRPLDNLDPEQATAEPYLSKMAGPRSNASTCGGFLSLRGREYPRGVGMFSGASIGGMNASRGCGCVRFGTGPSAFGLADSMCCVAFAAISLAARCVGIEARAVRVTAGSVEIATRAIRVTAGAVRVERGVLVTALILKRAARAAGMKRIQRTN